MPTPSLTGGNGGVCPARAGTMLFAAVIRLSAQSRRMFSILTHNIFKLFDLNKWNMENKKQISELIQILNSIFYAKRDVIHIF